MQNTEKIDWQHFSQNPNAIPYYFENPNTLIDWRYLSRNPNAISILEHNKKNICWQELALNPAIFTYDYEALKYIYMQLKQDIVEAALHPKRIFHSVKTEEDLEAMYRCYFDEY